ncbi:MAG: response regulator [Pseudomonadota bacterium]|nr:response regulator [Pseudomonadota bacterium]
MKSQQLVKAAAGSGRDPATQRARILLVDDDERNLLALSEVLKGIADIVTATSGRQALRHLLKSDFAVILLDVFMPGMDGYETAQLIRAREQTSFIPIIFVSAVNKEVEHLMRGYAMGAVDYVFKPVDPVMLQSKVSVFVELFSMRRQIEERAAREQKLLDDALLANSEKLEAEKALRLAEVRHSLAIRSLPIIIFAREMARELTPPRIIGGDLLGMTGFAEPPSLDDWRERIHPDDRERTAQSYYRLPDAGSLAIEYRWRRSDGEYRHFLEQTMLFGEGGGGSVEITGTILDVTEQKSLEAQLLHSGKMEAVGQLTGGVAHDFNNLLAAILGGVSLLNRRADLNAPNAKILDQVRHAAEQGAELVRRMMAFSRKQDLKPTSVAVESLCEAVGGLVEHALGGTIEIDWACPTHVSNVFVDRGQLELALVNLVLNARDAMPGGGTIGVAFENHQVEVADPGDLEPGRYVRLRVTDSGPGIPSEILSRVTEPFFTTKETGKGTGLGLSMVFGFVRQSGGRMNIENHDHVGAVVELILPASGDDAVSVVPAPIAAADADRYTVRSVLLVDDDDMVRTIVEEQLTDMGLTVCALSGGAAALQKLSEKPDDFDLLLTDFAMPGMNGAETIGRAALIAPSLRFLLMTGFADAETLASLPAHIEVIPKPIDYQRLARAFI